MRRRSRQARTLDPLGAYDPYQARSFLSDREREERETASLRRYLSKPVKAKAPRERLTVDHFFKAMKRTKQGHGRDKSGTFRDL